MAWQQIRLAVWILLFRGYLDILRRIMQTPRVHPEACRIHPRRLDRKRRTRQAAALRGVQEPLFAGDEIDDVPQ